eukprot:CFRG8104T1
MVEMSDTVSPQSSEQTVLLNTIRESVIGDGAFTEGPFGRRRMLYADYTASGKSLSFIEDYIRNNVLPMYGNTHTTVSATGRQSTYFRQEARQLIRNAVNASERDAVLFSGTGVTGAISHLARALYLEQYTHHPSGPAVVFTGPQEHHSNLLVWRESGADVVQITEDESGRIDMNQLTKQLSLYSNRPLLIGSFSAASNITGTLIDTDEVTVLLHKHNALSFWDYAAAGPYTLIDMNPVGSHDNGLAYKDAVFLSVHKFIGGVQTPGVLVAKKKLFALDKPPTVAGGGTVFFVSSDRHQYLRDIELREEGGTGGIVESVRAGMVFQLKQAVSVPVITSCDERICQKVMSAFQQHPNIVVLGSPSSKRLPIFSLMIKHNQRFLHYNFVGALLNDLFGIQCRGGCVCAGPYAQTLLGIDADLANKYQEQLSEDPDLDRHHLRRRFEGSTQEILRPGVIRISFSYFMDEKTVDFIVKAVCAVADFGDMLLPDYTFNPEDAIWTHVNYISKLSKNRTWLGNITYTKGKFDVKEASKFTTRNRKDVTDKNGTVVNKRQNDKDADAILDLDAVFKEGLFLLKQGSTVKGLKRSVGATLSAEAAWLRWFSYPEDGESNCSDGPVCPFIPKVYNGENIHCVEDPVVFRATRPVFAQPSVDVKSTFAPDSVSNSVTETSDTNSFVNPIVEPPVCILPRKPKVDHPKSSSEAVVEGNTMNTDLLDEGGFNLDLFDDEEALKALQTTRNPIEFKEPPLRLYKTFQATILEMGMIKNGDRILLCISGGKDSLSMLHLMKKFQHDAARKSGVHFTFGCATVDPQTEAFDPSPLKDYMAALGVPYFFMSQDLIEQAAAFDPTSLCSYCARMKRGMLYKCARRENYNVLAFGQHLDDLAESFMMSVLFNGMCRTMKANYTVSGGDLRMIRPMVNIRERDLREFADTSGLPIINENCPACFSEPTERMRMKQVLGSLELLHPHMFNSIARAIKPLMAIDRTGVETGFSGQSAIFSSTATPNTNDEIDD